MGKKNGKQVTEGVIIRDIAELREKLLPFLIENARENEKNKFPVVGPAACRITRSLASLVAEVASYNETHVGR